MVKKRKEKFIVCDFYDFLLIFFLHSRKTANEKKEDGGKWRKFKYIRIAFFHRPWLYKDAMLPSWVYIKNSRLFFIFFHCNLPCAIRTAGILIRILDDFKFLAFRKKSLKNLFFTTTGFFTSEDFFIIPQLSHSRFFLFFYYLNYSWNPFFLSAILFYYSPGVLLHLSPMDHKI